MSPLDKLIDAISTSCRDERSAAQADLAQLIWSQKISTNTIIELLTHANDRVRGATAWAIADLNGPIDAAKWLVQRGLQDDYVSVRYWTLRCACEMPHLRSHLSAHDLQQLCHDEQDEVRELASKLVQQIGLL